MVTNLPPLTESESIERLPPHNLEAEQSLLGSLLIDPRRDHQGRRLRQARGFLPAQQRSYLPRRASISTTGGSRPTSSPLSDELGRREQIDQVGGVAYLTSLLNGRPDRRPRRVLRPDCGADRHPCAA